MKNVSLITTMWDIVNEEQGEARMNELMSRDEFWGEMVREGASCDKHDGTSQDASFISNWLLAKVLYALQIQHEMEKGARLNETTARKSTTDWATSLLNIDGRLKP
jgi:hypothetical protein